MKKSTETKFRKYLKENEITLESYKGGHFKVKKGKALVATLSHTGDSSAVHECIGDLVRQELLPRDARRLRF